MKNTAQLLAAAAFACGVSLASTTPAAADTMIFGYSAELPALTGSVGAFGAGLSNASGFPTAFSATAGGETWAMSDPFVTFSGETTTATGAIEAFTVNDVNIAGDLLRFTFDSITPGNDRYVVNGQGSRSTTAIPEPATLGLLSAGLIGLMFTRRRAG